MKRVINISFATSASNFDQEVVLSGQKIYVSQYGCDFDLKVMRALIKEFDGKADVLGLQGLHPAVKLGPRTIRHRDSTELIGMVKHSEVVTGDLLRRAYLPWALRELIKKDPTFFFKKRVAFYSGIMDLHLARLMTEQTERLVFMDPYLHTGVAKELHSVAALEKYLHYMAPLLTRVPLSEHVRRRGVKESLLGENLNGFERSEIFISRLTLLERFRVDHLKNKTVIVDYVTENMLMALKDVGVHRVVSFAPQLPLEEGLQDNFSFTVIEGLLQCLRAEPLKEGDLLEFIDEFNLRPNISEVSASRNPARKFAFIAHPLSVSDLFVLPALKPFANVAATVGRQVEILASKWVPPILYGKISGVKSIATHQEALGDIYLIFYTPRQLLGTSPEKIYEVLEGVAKMASDNGADIIGLGAYTKIVGDGGVTVARNSPIPVTTGNSLSASATLWAARDACTKMGFLPPLNIGTTLRGRCMIIGATGSIGSACSKILSAVFQDVILVGRSAEKLLKIRSEVEELSPECKIHMVTDPAEYARSSDLIVTTTSSYDKKVLDIMTVKPGCVICDVSRPLDITEDDAIKRPDVLVVESGEIELPGEFKITCDMGVPDTVVYACLAETALLALEGRLENYTLSKNIDHTKVMEIYDLARKHGARLAAIRGHNGLITDREIELCRERALEALKDWKTE